MLLDEFIDLHPTSSNTDDKLTNLNSGIDTTGTEQVPTISKLLNRHLAVSFVNVASKHLIKHVSLSGLVE